MFLCTATLCASWRFGFFLTDESRRQLFKKKVEKKCREYSRLSVVFGILENYAIYDLTSSPNGGSLYFLSWITAVCSTLANGVLMTLVMIALCLPKKDCDEDFCPTITETSDVEMPPTKRKTPKSRADLGK